MSKIIRLEIQPNSIGVRIDKYLSAITSLGISRNYIQRLIEKKLIQIDGNPVKSSQKIKQNDHWIEIDLPQPEPCNIQPEYIRLDIIYEDEYLLVINKPCGMVVHPGLGNRSGTLVNALLHHCIDLSGIGGIERPGIVHRLDKGTSGLLIVAKNDITHRILSQQFKDRQISRIYLALVYGWVKEKEKIIETLIGRNPKERKKMAVLKQKGRTAMTTYRLIANYKGKPEFSLLSCQLQTGRTHQIRVHLAYSGHPVIGDILYGKNKIITPDKILKEKIEQLNGFALHATELSFQHPGTNDKMKFQIEPPAPFQNLIDYLNKR